MTREGGAVLNLIFDTCSHGGLKFNHAIFTTSEVWEDGTIIEGTPTEIRERVAVNRRVDFVDRNKHPEIASTMKHQRHYAALWEQLDPSSNVSIAPTVEGAIRMAREISEASSGSGGAHVLVTGSLHLIGAVLHVLKANQVSREKVGLV